MNETPYTVAEVAALMGVSTCTILRIFEREPGIIVKRNLKRKTPRIPRAVFLRVLRRLTR